jgi:hypothetical protein
MLLSEIEFGAFLTYSPNGVDDKARESQRWVRTIKDERIVGTPPMPASALVASRLRVQLAGTGLGSLLTPNAVLVPAPRSSLLKSGSLWVPYLLAKAMVGQGLGREVWTCLQRATPTRKAATAPSNDRPLAREHYASMSVTNLRFMHDEIVVVDDVVTRGATLLAAVSRLQNSLPGAKVSGFSVVRTISDPAEFRQMLDPCLGKISLTSNGQTHRRP